MVTTPTAATVDLRDPDWTPFDIPGGTAPVDMVRLHTDPDTRAVVVLVRFPAGWKRPVVGSYECAEELVVLEGSLELGGRSFGPRTWAWLPPRLPRAGMSTPGGLLAFARFEGAPRWVEGPSSPDGEIESRSLTLDGPQPARLGPHTRLRDGDGYHSWLYTGVPEAVHQHDMEVFVLEGRRWAYVPAGSVPPSTTAPAFCRVYDEGVRT